MRGWAVCYAGLARRLGHLLTASLLSACASLAPQQHAQQAAIDACAARYAKALPSQHFAPYSPVRGYEFLRINRYLADRVDAGRNVDRLAWLQWANGLANEAVGWSSSPNCVANLLPVLADSDAHWRSLARTAVVADEYRLGLRLLGLYPLSRWPFAAGVVRDHAATRRRQQAFAANLDPTHWQYYQPQPLADAIAPHIKPIGAVGLDAATVLAQLNRWAPTFALARGAGADNQPVALARDAAGNLLSLAAEGAGGDAPLYSYASVGEFGGQQSLQLNYQVWFARRPASHALDPLAGRLDGLHWRVHLDAALQPIAFDVMHTCGCWYQLYPAPGFQVENPEDPWQEPVYVGGTLPAEPDQVLYVQADDHSLLGIGRVLAKPARSLAMHPILWGAAGLSGPLSVAAQAYWQVFDSRGRVPESVRSERFYFWPMGIPAAGSMRAPGHHAIAFTGRRHFDEPRLLEALGLSARKTK